MRTTKLIHFVSSAWSPFLARIIPSVAVFLITVFPFADRAGAQDLRVMKKGLGSGTITSVPPGINCLTDCDETYSLGQLVTLTATADPGSTFAGWELDGSSTTTNPTTRDVTMSADRSVRAVFELTCQQTFIDGDVTTGSDTINITAHGFTADQKVQLLTTGALPAGLALATTYFIRSPTANDFALALTDRHFRQTAIPVSATSATSEARTRTFRASQRV